MVRRRDFTAAEAAYRRAIELNPSYVDAYQRYGEMLRAYLGRKEEALALHQKGLELDPLSTSLNMTLAEDYHELGRFEDALRQRLAILRLRLQPLRRSPDAIPQLFLHVLRRQILARHIFARQDNCTVIMAEVTDVDVDDGAEIIFGDETGKLHCFNHDGTLVDGFPIQTGGEVRGTPVVWDTDGDGLTEIVAALQRQPDVFGAKISGSGLGDCAIGIGYAALDELDYATHHLEIAPAGVMLHD